MMKNNHIISYAQNREDIILSGFFDNDENGFYVDVGAEHPTNLSVTKLFYDKGWNGINIEPIRREYKLFEKERPRDINLNIGIANKEGNLSFREYEGSGYSTFSEVEKKNHLLDKELTVKKFKDYLVNVVPLKNVFKKYKISSIQFIKIDVEGFEYEVLKSNDWEKYRPEVICIEANHINDDWRPFLKKQKYKMVFFDGLNEYYTDINTDRDQKFNYIEDIIYKEPIINSLLLEDYRIYEIEKKALENDLLLASKELDEAQNLVKKLQNELNEISSLKKHIKRTAKFILNIIDNKITNILDNKTTDLRPSKLKYSSENNITELLNLSLKYDKINLYKFNKKTHSSIALLVYKSFKKIFINTYKLLRGNL